MPGNYRTTNRNPNGPLFFGTLTPRTAGESIPNLFLNDLQVDLTSFFNDGGPYLSEGLYFSGATKPIKVHASASDSGTARHFTILPNTNHFMPIKNPTNVFLTAPDNSTTVTVRGH